MLTHSGKIVHPTLKGEENTLATIKSA
jgi:hypothetical protein